jgi:hypothetical protein
MAVHVKTEMEQSGYLLVILLISIGMIPINIQTPSISMGRDTLNNIGDT